MANLPGYTVRNMTREELDIAVEWARKEGWNPGLYDADSFYAQDPEGFFVGVLDGEIVGVVSGVKYEGSYGFAGFYIVKPEYRGQGYGMELVNKMLAYLSDRNVGADGVLENLEMYKKIGLQLDHLNARYKTTGTGSKQILPEITSLTTIPFDVVAKYDEEVFGFDRQKFLREWIVQPESFAFAAGNAEKITGYGVLRKCHTGYKIGPLFADSDEIANKLFDSLANQVTGEIFFDIPEVSAGAITITGKYKMEKVFATGRIYSKGRPVSMDLNKWYGLTSFELG